MRFCKSLLILSLAIGAPTGPAMSEVITLDPSSSWNVDYDDEQCTLARTFGPDDNRHAVFFRQWTPAQDFAFTAAGPVFGNFRSLRATEVQFNTGAEPRTTEPFVGDVEGFGSAVIYPGLTITKNNEERGKNGDRSDRYYESFPQLNLDQGGDVEFVSLAHGGNTIIFKTGDLRDAFEVMNACTQSLVNEWGLDVERHLTTTRMPKLSNFAAIWRKVGATYPRAALSRGEQAIFRVRVMVDENGTATDCVIYEVTRTQRLDSPACRPLMLGKYTPALDKDGQPFASFYTTSIVYRIN